MAGGSQKGSHKKWATKTRTGCSTCKKRRVKCDEERPSCQRCAARGVKCHYDDKKGLSSLSLTGWEILTPDSDAFGSSTSSQDQASTSRKSTELLRKSSKSSLISQSSLSNIRVLSPYRTVEEQKALKYWLNKTAPMMTRSDVGAYFWAISIPTVAWHYQPLRNALIATAMIFNSLLRRDSPEDYAIAQRKAVTHVNETIRELLTNNNIPPEVIILTSTVFWILEMAMGNVENAAMHFASAAKIASQLDLKTISDPLSARFVISCVDGLSTTVNPKLITNKPVEERQRQTQLRSEYSSRILKHAFSTLQSFQKIIMARQSPNQARALSLLHGVEVEFIWILERWPEDEVAEHDSQEYVQQVINEQTPFNGILNRLVSFLESDNIIEMAKFDVEMKTTLEHFLWLAGSRTLAERQHTFNAILFPDRPKRITKRSLIMEKED